MTQSYLCLDGEECFLQGAARLLLLLLLVLQGVLLLLQLTEATAQTQLLTRLLSQELLHTHTHTHTSK